MREFLVNETIFKKVSHLKIEIFTKNFFPNKLKDLGAGNKTNIDFSDSDESNDGKNKSLIGKKMSIGVSRSV